MRLHNKASWTPRIHTITTAGTPEHLGGYISADTISFATNVITDSGSGFLTKGFKSGDEVTVSGSSDNDETYDVVTAAAGTLTLGSGVVLTTEAAGSTVTVSTSPRAPQDVDDGVSVNVRAHPDNTGLIYVANSATNALSTSTAMSPLYANQSINLQVKDLQSIWVDTATSGNKVVISYES